MATKTLTLWRIWARSGKVRSSVLVRAVSREAAIEHISAGLHITRVSAVL